jgi:nicotinic acid mononucleotide adenylyltransferase
MLRRLTENQPRFAVGDAQGGLYFELAREAEETFPGSSIYLLCGRDAADRIVHWEYDEPGLAERMLQRYPLLVASRHGSFSPPINIPVVPLACETLDEYSSTQLREAVSFGQPWRHMAPAAIVDLIEQIYRT